MTGPERRDHALGRAIGALPVPGHGPGFWDELRAQLEAAPLAPASGPATPEAIGLHAGRPDPDPRRPAQGPPPRWLLAAAAVVLVAAGLGLAARLAARSDDDGGFDAAPPTGPTTTYDASTITGPVTSGPLTTVGAAPVTTTTVSTPPPVFALGPPVELGPGSLAGFSSDGRFAYVSDANPRDEVGCEGGPGSSLFVQPVDGTGRTEVAELAGAAGYQVVTGPSGQIAVLLFCDTRLAQTWVGTIGPDGVPVDLRELALIADPFLEYLGYLDTLQWSVDGSALLVVRGDELRAYRIDPTNGTSTELGLGPVVYVAQDGAGRLVVVTSEGQIRYEGQTVGTVTLTAEESFLEAGVWGVTGLAVDDQGAVWVATTGQGVQRVTPGGPVESIDPTATQLLPRPDGKLLWVAGTGAVRALGDGAVVEVGALAGSPLAGSPLAGSTVGLDPTGSVLSYTTGWEDELPVTWVVPLDRAG